LRCWSDKVGGCRLCLQWAGRALMGDDVTGGGDDDQVFVMPPIREPGLALPGSVEQRSWKILVSWIVMGTIVHKSLHQARIFHADSRLAEMEVVRRCGRGEG
jgi:hypothetical protein